MSVRASVSAASVTRRPTRVLIVDDDEAKRYSTRRVLERAGYQIEEALDGTSGIALALGQPDLIILDVKLPDIDGFEVCRRLKADPRTADIGVIHLSASYVASTDRTYGLEAGADSYLAVPVAPAELVASIEAVLRVRRAEARARRLAREWQSTFDAISDGVALTDERGVLLRCNQAFAELAARRPEELAGQSFASIALDVLRLEGLPTLEQMRSGRARQTRELAYGERWLRVTADPVHDDAGREIGGAYIFSDITLRKLIEEQRAHLLASEQEAREVAETASRLKDEFLATVSHELRTPLTAILGWSRMLLERAPAELQRGLHVVERNARLQAQVVEDLLDVSRIASGKLSLHRVPVELEVVMRSAVEAVAHAAEGKSVTLTSRLELDGGSGVVLGDENRLQQVVANLLFNAIKFTPEGGRVDAVVRSDGTSGIIEVIDNGQGISPQFLPYVFDRFRQADGSRTRMHGGLGLGLAIVRNLVELHGGTVSADSAGPGRGARFTVRVPLAQRSRVALVDDGRPSRGSADLVAAPPESILHGLQLLVVEDDDDTIELLELVLARMGAEVASARSVASAMEVLSRFTPDVVVSDIGMPGEDGYAFIRKLRALSVEAGGTVPAIALTAYARTADREHVLAAGFQAHVAKPVEPDELARTIAHEARRARALRTAAAPL